MYLKVISKILFVFVFFSCLSLSHSGSTASLQFAFQPCRARRVGGYSYPKKDGKKIKKRQAHLLSFEPFVVYQGSNKKKSTEANRSDSTNRTGFWTRLQSLLLHLPVEKKNLWFLNVLPADVSHISLQKQINDLAHFDHAAPRNWKFMKWFSLCYGQIFSSCSINYF